MSNSNPNTPTPFVPHKPDQLLEGHSYDGIQEYDNNLPLWWVAIFIISIFWGFFYFVNIHHFHFVNTYEDDLAIESNKIDQLRLKDEEKKWGGKMKLTENTLILFAKNPEKVANGQKTYTQFCASCHGVGGGGGIGTNLTDEFWLHGGAKMDMFNTISKGVLDKGMPSWEAQISSTDRANLVAFISSLYGTNPANPKAPEGEKFDPSKVVVAPDSTQK